MLSPKIAEGHQTPLIHEVHADDQYLLTPSMASGLRYCSLLLGRTIAPTPQPITTRSMSFIAVNAKPPQIIYQGQVVVCEALRSIP